MLAAGRLRSDALSGSTMFHLFRTGSNFTLSRSHSERTDSNFKLKKKEKNGRQKDELENIDPKCDYFSFGQFQQEKGTQMLFASAQQSTNFLQPGSPTKEDEGKEVEEIGPFRRLLHKFGIDTNPAGVVIGFLFLCGAAGGGYFVYKEKQKVRAEAAKEGEA